MSHSVSRIIMTAIVVAAAGLYAEAPRCSATARECDQQIRQKLSGRRYSGLVVQEKNPGLVIKSVAEDSPAWNAGLQAGDRLIAVNDKSLTQASARDFKQILADARETGRIAMIIWRRGAYSRVEFRLEPYTKEQIEKIITAHVSQSHPSTAGAQ
jgi:C-terminal processing protease CtpA/Prc